MPTLKFFDVKKRKKFTTDKFTLKKVKNGRVMAVATAPSGAKAFVFVKKGFKK